MQALAQHVTTELPIGVISDTHGLLRPEALVMLEGCELILHLGDVGSADTDAIILERLAELAPVVAVRGNIDTAPWAEALPLTLDITVNGWRLHLVHILQEFDSTTPLRRRAPRPLAQTAPRVAGKPAAVQPRRGRQASLPPAHHPGQALGR